MASVSIYFTSLIFLSAHILMKLMVVRLQLTFVFLVLPCLLLGYLGQAAYLMENHADGGQAFFSSVPSTYEYISSSIMGFHSLHLHNLCVVFFFFFFCVQ